MICRHVSTCDFRLPSKLDLSPTLSKKRGHKVARLIAVADGASDCVPALRLSEELNIFVLVLKKGYAEDNIISRTPLISQGLMLDERLQPPDRSLIDTDQREWAEGPCLCYGGAQGFNEIQLGRPPWPLELIFISLDEIRPADVCRERQAVNRRVALATVHTSSRVFQGPRDVGAVRRGVRFAGRLAEAFATNMKGMSLEFLAFA